MSFIRKYKKGQRTYLAEVESKRVGGKVVQRFIRYVGKEAEGRTILVCLNIWESTPARFSAWCTPTAWTTGVSTTCPNGSNGPI
jgi:hypothetical protein